MFSILFWMSLPRATLVPWTSILQVTSLPPVVVHPYGLRMPRPYDYARSTSGIFLTWENHHHHPHHHYLCHERMTRSIVKAVPIKFVLKIKMKTKAETNKMKKVILRTGCKISKDLRLALLQNQTTLTHEGVLWICPKLYFLFSVSILLAFPS